MREVNYIDESQIRELALKYIDQLPKKFCEELSIILDSGRHFDPQPHGHWIRYEKYVVHPNPYMDNYFMRKSVCSHCNHTIHVPERMLWDNCETTACSVCGCIMDDGKKEIHPYV